MMLPPEIAKKLRDLPEPPESPEEFREWLALRLRVGTEALVSRKKNPPPDDGDPK
jgi:hypothetical protein